jgi:hypothetical protein
MGSKLLALVLAIILLVIGYEIYFYIQLNRKTQTVLSRTSTSPTPSPTPLSIQTIGSLPEDFNNYRWEPNTTIINRGEKEEVSTIGLVTKITEPDKTYEIKLVSGKDIAIEILPTTIFEKASYVIDKKSKVIAPVSFKPINKNNVVITVDKYVYLMYLRDKTSSISGNVTNIGVDKLIVLD